jgi:hypothetical protein
MESGQWAYFYTRFSAIVEFDGVRVMGLFYTRFSGIVEFDGVRTMGLFLYQVQWNS